MGKGLIPHRSMSHEEFSRIFIQTSPIGKLALLLSTWFGSGLLPKAPGTFGSLFALPLLLVFHVLNVFFEGIFLVAFILLAVWASEVSRKCIGRDDPSEVVIDEAAGLLVTFFFLPLSWVNILLGFVLFRVFDVFKPFPIRIIDRRLKGGWGIVLDDVLAGIYANLCIRGISFIF